MTNMAFTTMPVDYSEQIKIISNFFNKWSECERTVAICKLLKLLPGFWLKFVLSTIEQQFFECTDNEHIQLMEQESNSKLHLTKLYETYKTTCTSDPESYFIGEKTNNNNNNNYHHLGDNGHKKEKVLNDILRYTLLLKTGNDDAKKVYLSLIPYMVEDARRGIVPTKIVQQILSFLLIHPALNDYDRQSLKQHNQTLQEYIRNSIQTEQYNSNNWQIVAPPSVNLNSTQSLSSTCSSQRMYEPNIRSNENQWETQSIPFSQDHNDIDGTSASCDGLFQTISQPADLNSTKSTDVSFSKNGTEIDFDPDLDRSNIHFTYDYLPILNDHIAVKTRRSNSLTTGVMHHNTLLATMTTSTENLSTAMYKPRSFSLSIESPRSSIASSSSETRLNDFNSLAKTFQSNQPGMSNMNAWLKSLRLHKYQSIFIHLTYDQMMEVTEEYLTSMSVTKGARNKLVNCIQKLGERFHTLEQFEHNLIIGAVTLSNVLAGMWEILQTPIKPIDLYNNKDVATQFMKVLSLAYSMFTMPNQRYSYDQQVVSTMVAIIFSASHNEAFVSRRSQLREYQYHMSELNKQFPKTYSKNGAGNSGAGNSNKSKWSSSSSKPNRKNSNSMSIFASMQPQSAGNCSASNGKQNKQSYANTKYYSTLMTGYNKSSSYPNFNSSGGIQHGSHHHSYHRHSASNLITITPSQTTATIVTTPSASHLHQQQKSAMAISFTAPKTEPTISTSHLSHQKASSALTISVAAAAIATKFSQNNNNSSTSNANLKSTSGRSHSFGGAENQQMLSTNVAGDLSSDREFFIQQIAEQAIN